jgi:hypothetical protein
MKTARNTERGVRARARGERGAALLTVLILSTLLMLVAGALVASTGLSAVNAADSTPELQTYYAAETGLQASLRVLRGNVAPNPLFLAQPTGSAIYDVNKLSFRDAITRSRSNLAGDPATYPSGGAFPFRLSRWLPYNYTPPGGAYADRVAITPGYTPAGGLAYSVAVEDMDNTQTITYTTTGAFSNGSCSGGVCEVTITHPTVPGNKITVSYTPQASTTVTATAPVSGGVGQFSVSRTGAGAVTIPANVQFQLVIDQTKPWPARLVVGGTLSGSIGNVSGGTSTSNLRLTFSNISAIVGGTKFAFAANPLQLNNAGTYSAGPYPLNATITAPEPKRLRVTSTGYGPGGARKVLEMIVSRYSYSLDPPAPLVIRGSDDTSQTMTFNLGSSAAKKYTGKDLSGEQAQLPTIAINLHDWTKGYDGVIKGATVDDPKFSILDIDSTKVTNPWTGPSPAPSPAAAPTNPSFPQLAVTPALLTHPDLARDFLNDMEKYARENGRYFTSLTGMAGSTANPALTFVDGNCVLDGGRGLLIVTGNLELKGNDDFQGIVMLLGNGRVTRSGGGNGKILGGWYVAKFPRARPAGCAYGCTPGTSGCAYACGFGAPYVDGSGGGNALFQYDWREIRNANSLIGSGIMGIDEK